MEAVMNGGAPAPVENVETPAVAPDGVAPEAVKPAAEEAPAAKPEAKSDDEPKGVAKRIKELTDRIKAAEARETRYLSMLERQQTPTQPAKSDDEPVKTLKDFNYDDKAFLEYADKRAEARAEKAAKAAAERWKAEQEAISRRAKFDERVAQFAKNVEDYNEVVTERTPVSEPMADFLMDSDEAGALMYYLGNNPDEASKLYHMSPVRAAKELQKLEDRLVTERKKAAEKPVSQAPPPAPKIEAKDASIQVKSTSDPEADKLSDAEWFRLAEKERQKRRKAKAEA
jgi:hypothetical protein